MAHVSYRKKQAVIFQFHGFDGQGWGSLAFSNFKHFVRNYKTLLCNDGLAMCNKLENDNI